MLQPKLPVNINNHYPISRSPPMFDSSSPGPDPYHSLQSLHNVYEELHPAHDSDVDSEFHAHSDDDFAEDELSLAGETTAVLMATSTSTTGSTTNHLDGGLTQTTAMIPTIYNESNLNYRRMAAGADATVNANVERDSILSTTSSTNDRDRNGAGDSSVSSRSSSGATRISRNNMEHIAGPFGGARQSHSKTLNNRDINNIPDMTGVLGHNFNQYHNHVNMTNGNHINGSNNNNKRMISNRINNNTIGGGHHHANMHNNHHPHSMHGGGHSANNNARAKSRDNICTGVSCVECRVERQNQVNRQMSSTMHHNKKRGGGGGGNNAGIGHSQMDHPAAISTIFHGRTINGNNSNFQFPDVPTTTASNQWANNGNHRMRTMPYASANCQPRSTVGANANHDPAYDYAQPVFHEGLLYDSGFAADVGRLQQPIDRNDCSYITPEYTSLGSSASGISGNHPHAIYSRDSSFGSDSGYSRGESGGSASGILAMGRQKKHIQNSKTMGKSVL